MRILILHKWLVCGGVESALINYLRIFKEMGIACDLLITNDMSSHGGNFFEKDIPESVPYHYIYPSHHDFNEYHMSQMKQGKKSIWTKCAYEIKKLKRKLHYLSVLRRQIRLTDYQFVIDFSECLDDIIRVRKWLNFAGGGGNSTRNITLGTWSIKWQSSNE